MKKNLLLLFGSLLVALVLAEILLRLSGHNISYNEKSTGGRYASPFESRSQFGYGWDETKPPGTDITDNRTEYHYVWKSNNEGLRGKNISLAKTGKRLLVFGDSFTEGMGAPDDSTYPALLQQLIHQFADTTLEVINCGPAGSDLFSEYKLLTGKMLKYRPDYVLVTSNSTDLFDFSVRGGFERFKPNNKTEYRQPPWYEPLYAKIYLVRFLVNDIAHRDARFLTPEENKAMEQMAIRANSEVIDSFRLICQKNGCRFGMLFHPLQHESLQNLHPMSPLMTYCRQQHIPYADEAAFLQQRAAAETQNIYWPADGHFNSQGYALLAQCAYQFCRQQGWVRTR